jgi:hypothetical protein
MIFRFIGSAHPNRFGPGTARHYTAFVATLLVLSRRDAESPGLAQKQCCAFRRSVMPRLSASFPAYVRRGIIMRGVSRARFARANLSPHAVRGRLGPSGRFVHLCGARRRRKKASTVESGGISFSLVCATCMASELRTLGEIQTPRRLHHVHAVGRHCSKLNRRGLPARR